MHMLVWKVMAIAILCGAAWLLLHEALLWFERRITSETAISSRGTENGMGSVHSLETVPIEVRLRFVPHATR